jgi:hypothetical protein
VLPSTSVIDGALPLYGTCSSSTPGMLEKRSPAGRVSLPLSAEP